MHRSPLNPPLKRAIVWLLEGAVCFARFSNDLKKEGEKNMVLIDWALRICQNHQATAPQTNHETILAADSLA